MFAKKLLSIISLIAIGGITKTIAVPVNPSGMTSCTGASVSNYDTKGDCTIGENTYCIDDDGIIYGYSGNSSTCAINAPGIYAFTNAGGNDGSTSIVLGSNTEVTAGQLLLYRCSYGHENKFKCSRTYGYALINSKVYTVQSDNEVVETELSAITGDCKSRNPGVIISTKELCLKVDGDSPILSRTIDSATATPNYYIMANVAGNIFTGADVNNKNIVVEARPNAIVFDEDAYDYCVTAGTNVVDPTFKEFCDNAADQCTVKADYEAGPVWKRSDEEEGDDEDGCVLSSTDGNSSKCTPYGYYIATDANGGKPTESGVLFNCSAADTCGKVEAVGYFKYADVENKYIKCSAVDTCVSVDVNTDAIACNDVAPSGTGKRSSKYTNGDIINDGTNDILCLDVEVATGIPINAANDNKEYFAPNGSIFLSDKAGKYAKVIVKTSNDASVTLSPKAQSTPSTYVYTDNLFKVYERGDSGKATDVCAATKVIMEFKYSEPGTNSDLYEKKVEYEWPDLS